MSTARNRTSDVLVTLSGRVFTRLRRRVWARACQSNSTPSAAVAELLAFALDLEDRLQPFLPALQRLQRDDHLPLPDAVAHLLWLGVEEPSPDEPP